MFNILLTGQCSIHWGRMEFGNIGNYYILEPLLENIKKKYSDSIIYSTLQISNELCKKYNIKLLPLEYYYSFDDIDNNLNNTLLELEYSKEYTKNKDCKKTEFMKYIILSDVIIQFDGDIWGDNADEVGKDRFLCGLYKSIIMQNCNNNVIMFAGSPGPFINHKEKIKLIKDTYSKFKYVINREEISTKLLKEQNFDLSKTYSLPCPSWLFTSNLKSKEIEYIYNNENINLDNEYEYMGFILCGWNMPLNNWNLIKRESHEFIEFEKTIEYILKTYPKIKIVMISHNNAFIKEPFELKKGRDYELLFQLYNILKNKKIIDMNRIIILKEIYGAHETKGILSKLDYLISGRLHGSIGALTSYVPTIMIKYDNGPPCHKLEGFAKFIKYDSCIAKPIFDDMRNKVNYLVKNKKIIKEELIKNINIVKNNSINSFSYL